MNDKFRYTKQSIDPSILSVLDIAADGKVISAQDWTELWSLVIKRINKIDTFNVEVNEFCVAWDDTINTLTAVVEDFNNKYNAFKNGYVHYGADEPTNPETLFWVEPVSELDDELLATRGDLTSRRTAGNGVVAGNIPTNAAYAEYTYAGGSENVAGCLGFKITDIAIYGNYLVGRIAGDASVLATYTSGNSICLQWGQVFDYSVNAAYIDYTPGTSYTVFRLDKIPDGFNISDANEGYLWVPAAPNIGNVVLGGNAYAEGFNNKAVQYASHVEGYNNIAASKYAHAEGRDNIAGWASHTEGANNKALGLCSHSEGSNNLSSRNNTHAEGTYTQALFDNAHAEGSHTIAGTATYGNAAHAEGKGTTATGDGSHAEGVGSEASGFGSHAEGAGKATQEFAHAEGTGRATGVRSHAEGSGTEASAVYAHAEGESTRATKQAAHSEGSWTFAEGVASHTEGQSSSAKGKAAHAEGVSTKAQKEAAHAEGKNTDANGVAAHAGGIGTVAVGEAQTVLGKYNVEEWDGSLVVVGIGTQSARKTGFKIYGDGSIGLMGTAGIKKFTPAMIDKLYNLLSE